MTRIVQDRRIIDVQEGVVFVDAHIEMMPAIEEMPRVDPLRSGEYLGEMVNAGCRVAIYKSDRFDHFKRPVKISVVEVSFFDRRDVPLEIVTVSAENTTMRDAICDAWRQMTLIHFGSNLYLDELMPKTYPF